MRGRHRGAPSSSSRFSSRPFQRTKKCFVCGTIGCWSTNHTRQERDNSKKKFGDRYPEYKDRPGYERNLQRWITEYEVDDDEGIAQYFGDLSVDTHDDYATDSRIESFFTESEQFYISSGQLQGSESVTVNTLDDNALNHQITLSDKTVSSISPASYVINSSSDSQYNDIEFKGLLIGSGVSTQSTGGIGQLKALQQQDTSVQLDKSTAGSANFTFGIGSTSSIGSVNLDTPLGSITFHIVPLNIPFLICLADMDKLGVFFNNVTNQVIQSQTHTQPARSYPVIRKYDHAFLPWHTSVYIASGQKEKDEIRNLGTNKAYEKSCLVSENLSAASQIARHYGTGTAEPGLVTKKGEPPRTSLHISHPDQPPSLLLGSTLSKNAPSDVCMLGKSKCATMCEWPFSSATYQIQQGTNEKGKQASTERASRKQARIKKGNTERASTGI